MYRGEYCGATTPGVPKTTGVASGRARDRTRERRVREMENYAETGVERSTDGLRRRTTFRCPKRKPLRRVHVGNRYTDAKSSSPRRALSPAVDGGESEGDGDGDGDDSHSACCNLSIIKARQQHSRCGLPALWRENSRRCGPLRRRRWRRRWRWKTLSPPPPVATHLPASPLVVRRDWSSAQPGLLSPPSSRRSIHRQGRSPRIERIERFWVYCTWPKSVWVSREPSGKGCCGEAWEERRLSDSPVGTGERTTYRRNGSDVTTVRSKNSRSDHKVWASLLRGRRQGRAEIMRIRTYVRFVHTRTESADSRVGDDGEDQSTNGRARDCNIRGYCNALEVGLT